MALDLKKLSNTGNNNVQRSSYITGELVRFELKDPKKASPGEDFAVIRLRSQHDGFPDYTEDEDGAPTTEIKVLLSKREVKGEFAPLQFFDLKRGKDLAKPCASGSVLLFDNCYYDARKGYAVAGWVRALTHGPENDTERAPTGFLMSVGKEYYEDDNGTRTYNQERYLSLEHEATAFSSMEQFKKAVAEALVPQPDIGGDRPAVWVRILNVNDPNDRATTHIRLRWKAGENGEDGRMMSPEESIEAWLNSPRNAAWVDNISQAGSADVKDYIFEVIPHFWWKTGEKSLPSKNKYNRNDADQFQYRLQDSEKTYSGFALATMGLKRKITPAIDDEPERIGTWFATTTVRFNRFDKNYSREELVTPNLPKAIANLFHDNAIKRGLDALDEYRANKSVKSDAADEDIGFAEPDHDVGRSVSPR